MISGLAPSATAVTQLDLSSWSAALANGTVDALIDVRSPEEFSAQWGRVGACTNISDPLACTYGHVAGAYFLPNLQHATEEELVTLVGGSSNAHAGLVACSGLRLAFICHSGVRSNAAAVRLQQAYAAHDITAFNTSTVHGGALLNSGGGTQAYYQAKLPTRTGFARAPWPGCVQLAQFAATWNATWSEPTWRAESTSVETEDRPLPTVAPSAPPPPPLCSGHGQIFPFESRTYCECDPCYSGAACETLEESCPAEVGIVELSFLLSYWNAARDADVTLTAGYRMPYQGGEVWDPKLPPTNDLTKQLDDAIRTLHATAANVRTDGYYIVPGLGASAFLGGAVFAYSTLTAKHVDVHARLPAYGGFADAAAGLQRSARLQPRLVYVSAGVDAAAERAWAIHAN